MVFRSLAVPTILQAEGLEADVDVRRRVREQHHVLDAEVAQNLRADADFDLAAISRCPSLLRPPPARRSIHSETLIWAADRGSARSRRGPRPRSPASRWQCWQLLPSPMPSRSAEHVDGVHAHQHRARLRQVTLDERQVLARLDRRLVDVKLEAGRRTRFRPCVLADALDDAVVAQPVADQILDGADLEAVRAGRTATRSGMRAMVPSSFMISQMTAAG